MRELLLMLILSFLVLLNVRMWGVSESDFDSNSPIVRMATDMPVKEDVVSPETYSSFDFGKQVSPRRVTCDMYGCNELSPLEQKDTLPLGDVTKEVRMPVADAGISNDMSALQASMQSSMGDVSGSESSGLSLTRVGEKVGGIPTFSTGGVSGKLEEIPGIGAIKGRVAGLSAITSKVPLGKLGGEKLGLQGIVSGDISSLTTKLEDPSISGVKSKISGFGDTTKAVPFLGSSTGVAAIPTFSGGTSDISTVVPTVPSAASTEIPGISAIGIGSSSEAKAELEKPIICDELPNSLVYEQAFAEQNDKSKNFLIHVIRYIKENQDVLGKNFDQVQDDPMLARNENSVGDLLTMFFKDEYFDELILQYLISLLTVEMKLVEHLIYPTVGNAHTLLNKRAELVCSATPTIKVTFDTIVNMATENGLISERLKESDIEEFQINQILNEKEKKIFLHTAYQRLSDARKYLRDVQNEIALRGLSY